MTIVWAKPKMQGRGASHAGALSYSLNNSGADKKSGAPRKQFVVRLSMALMKEMRWVVGDRVQLGYDQESNSFVLKRDPDGYSLSAHSARKNADLKGKTAGARVQIQRPAFVPEDLPSASFEIADCKIEGLHLIFPAIP